ncbi:MAG: class I SAM-dependent methyltransferase [Alphaproteobacteria bacterium]|nr:class I SAM-dependent methyltransferase [Alphaproteobacteria bacterium]
MTQAPEIDRHYGRGGLLDRLLAALRDAGKDVEHLSIEDLAPIDELHSRRRAATVELARLLAPERDARVIDVGAGLGGPAHYLAHTFGCDVTGIDATAEFVAVANDLARRTGLASRVRFEHGSALALPFADRSFDLAWTQNVAMNIADRATMYAELYRVLRPGGRLVLQDVAQGPGGDIVYPVVWADAPAISFVRTPEETRALLEGAGFAVLAWEDKSDVAIAEIEAERARLAAAGGGSRPPLGLQLVIGDSAGAKMRNGARNSLERRTLLINALLARG